jgi:hypothetical protein
MTQYESYITDLQTQFVSALNTVGETQAKLIEAVQSVPATIVNGQPSTSELVEKSFDFVTQVLEAQKDMTLRLIRATAVKPPKAAARHAA